MTQLTGTRKPEIVPVEYQLIRLRQTETSSSTEQKLQPIGWTTAPLLQALKGYLVYLVLF